MVVRKGVSSSPPKKKTTPGEGGVSPSQESSLRGDAVDNNNDDEALALEALGKVTDKEAPVPVVPCVCPLCLSLCVHDPVVLHTEGPHADGSSSACVACRGCVLHWVQLSGRGLTASRGCPQCHAALDLSSSEQQSIPLVSLHEEEDRLLQRAQSSSSLKSGGKKPQATPTAVLHILNQKSQNGGDDDGADATPMCGNCEEVVAEFDCLNCGFPLCVGCRETTHNRGKFKSHEIVTVGSNKKKVERHCSAHPDDPLNLFCTTCNIGVCVTCCFGGAHNDHAVDRLQKVSADGKRVVGALLEDILAQSKRAGSSKASLESVTPLIQKKESHIVEEIQHMFHSLRQALADRESELLDQARTFLVQTTKLVDQRRCALEETRAQAQELSDSLGSSIERAHDADFMSILPLIRPRVELLQQQFADADCGDGTDNLKELTATLDRIAFTQSPASTENILNALRSLGRVTVPQEDTHSKQQQQQQASAKSTSASVPSSSATRLQHHLHATDDSVSAHSELPTGYGRGVGRGAAAVSAVATGNAVAASKFAIPSLNIVTQFQSSSAAEELAPVIPPISKRKQFLNLNEEAQAGEPVRKSANRVTSANPAAAATMPGISHMFLPKAKQHASPNGQNPPAAGGGDPDAQQQAPVSRSAAAGLLPNFQLKL